MSNERARRAETIVTSLCDQCAAGADLDPEIRGAAVVAEAAGVGIDRLAEITGATTDDIRGWVRDYRERAGSHPGGIE